MIFLAILAFLINATNRRMLALTLVVSASIYVPVPRHTYEAFYIFCIASESAVAGVAWLLRAEASTAIIVLCALLNLAHVTALQLDGFPPFSPYRLIVPIFEHAQIIACIILSNTLAPKLRNR